MHSILAMLTSLPAILAEGINTGNNVHEGYGGLLGIAVVVAAVLMTFMIVRGLGKEKLEEDAEQSEESSKQDEREEEHAHGHAALAHRH